jgi:hypothetical protein
MVHLATNSSSGDSAAGVVALLVGLTIFVLMYYIPTVVAVIRKVPNVGSVAVVNTMLGWTFVGWVVALAMAARSSARQHIVVIDPPGGPDVLGGMIGPPPPPLPPGF